MELLRFVTFLIGVILALSITRTQACTEEEQNQCHLPDCLCPGLTIPGDLPAAETPQIVYMTFDDAVTVTNFEMYERIIFHRKNPNGHPISATFYTTHEYTDYNKTRFLWELGHEIGAHSISHQVIPDYWLNLNAQGWREEILEQKQMLAYFADIPEDAISGMRAPFLQTGGDTMMGVIAGDLSYDCSRPTQLYVNPGLWPYTMDFDQGFQDCQIEPCAVEPYPGFWNVPMVDWFGGNGAPCAMLDACLPDPNTTELVLELFTRNFLRSYHGNRAPFGLFTHAAWLDATLPGHESGYVAFLDYLATLPDVFIVSVEKGLEWVKDPTPMSAIQDFVPWQHVPQARDCTVFPCHYDAEDTPFGEERYMVSCKTCPDKYPWVGNAFGDDI